MHKISPVLPRSLLAAAGHFRTRLQEAGVGALPRLGTLEIQGTEGETLKGNLGVV